MKKRLKFTGLNVDRRVTNLVVLSLMFSIAFFISIALRGYILENNSLPGKEAYFSTAIASDILNFRENPAISARAVPEVVWPALIAFFSIIFRVNEEYSIIALSFIFGILSLILIYLVIDKLGFKKRNLAIVFFLISPATIWMFSTFSKFILPFFFAILTLYLLLSEKYVPALITLGITCLFGAVSGISALAFSLLGFKRGFWKWFAKGVIVCFLLISLIYFAFPVFPEFSFSFENLFSLFASLSEFGINLFAFLLASIGIIVTWKERRERKELFSIYLTFIILLILSVLNKEFIFFFNFILIFLAAVGFTKLIERSWASNLIRVLTLLILIIGMITPMVVIPLRVASLEPSREMINALGFLRAQEDGAVLSVKENGYWINRVGEKETFVDEFMVRVNKGLEEEALGMLNERNLERLEREFGESNIKYILMDRKAKQLFRTKDEGILLLFLYTDRFEKIYDEGGIEIWKFLGEGREVK